MKHIKLFENIDWENWDIEENDTLNKIPDNISLKDLEEYIDREVRISKDSKYYEENTSTNPRNMNGRIINIFKDIDIILGLPIRVQWNNGEYNAYNPKDLELI
jgi:hypothetical protein